MSGLIESLTVAHAGKELDLDSRLRRPKVPRSRRGGVRFTGRPTAQAKNRDA